MDQIFNSITDHSRSYLDIKRLKTIFGNKKRPSRKRNKKPRLELAIERPIYELTIFKIDCDSFTVKFYSRGERVLRAEAVLHNAKAFSGRRSINNLKEVIIFLKNILDRFMDAVS